MQFIYMALRGKKNTSEVSSKEMCYFKQDIILEISLHACELSSQASIKEGSNSATWNSNNKIEGHELEFQLMKSDTQNTQPKNKVNIFNRGHE